MKVTPTIYYIPCFTRVKQRWKPLRGIVGTTLAVVLAFWALRSIHFNEERLRIKQSIVASSI